MDYTEQLAEARQQLQDAVRNRDHHRIGQLAEVVAELSRKAALQEPHD